MVFFLFFFEITPRLCIFLFWTLQRSPFTQYVHKRRRHIWQCALITSKYIGITHYCKMGHQFVQVDFSDWINFQTRVTLSMNDVSRAASWTSQGVPISRARLSPLNLSLREHIRPTTRKTIFSRAFPLTCLPISCRPNTYACSRNTWFIFFRFQIFVHLNNYRQQSSSN